MFKSLIRASFHSVLTKIITKCIVEGRSKWCYTVCLHFAAKYSANFLDLAKSWALLILNVFLVFATVVASVVGTLLYVAYYKGDI